MWTLPSSSPSNSSEYVSNPRSRPVCEARTIEEMNAAVRKPAVCKTSASRGVFGPRAGAMLSRMPCWDGRSPLKREKWEGRVNGTWTMASGAIVPSAASRSRWGVGSSRLP